MVCRSEGAAKTGSGNRRPGTVFIDASKSSDTVPLVPMKGKAYDRDYVGEMQTYTARYEDTMVQIARAYSGCSRGRCATRGIRSRRGCALVPRTSASHFEYWCCWV